MDCDRALKSNSSKLLERLTGHEAASNYRPTNYLWMCTKILRQGRGGPRHGVEMGEWKQPKVKIPTPEFQWPPPIAMDFQYPPLYPVIFLEMSTATAILNS